MAAAEARRGLDGPAHIAPRLLDSVIERLAEGEPGGNRGGKRAAGAMGGCRMQPRIGESMTAAGIDQQVDQFVARQMSAFQQHGARPQRQQRLRRRRHRRRIGDGHAGQRLGLGQVRRDHRGARNQLFAQGGFRFGLQQAGAAFRHHHRIDHQRHIRRMAVERGHHRFDDVGAVQHAGLDRIGADILQHHP